MKKLKKTLIGITVVLVILTAAALIYFFGAHYSYFDKISTKQCEIPGLVEGFTPQGLAYDEAEDCIVVCGFMKDTTKPSRVYILSGENYSEQRYVTMTSDNEAVCKHTGGVTVYQNAIFVVGEGVVYRLNKSDVYGAEAKTAVEVVDNFETENGADFVTVKGDELWVGEFYRKGNYETYESHHYMTEDETKNMALAFCYNIDLTHQYGVSSKTPTKALSLPAQAQGMDFYSDGRIVLSTSYSLPDSHMYVYSNVLSAPTSLKFNYKGTEIPVYMLSSQKVIKDFNLPCMSEEIFVKDNSVWVIFESACSKYKWFTRTRLRNIYSLEIDFN